MTLHCQLTLVTAYNEESTKSTIQLEIALDLALFDLTLASKAKDKAWKELDKAFELAASITRATISAVQDSYWEVWETKRDKYASAVSRYEELEREYHKAGLALYINKHSSSTSICK